MNTAWEQILNLIKKTNERCIVTDLSGEKAFIVMTLDEYERLISVKPMLQKEKSVQLAKEPQEELTDSLLLNKINRDIAIWRSVQKNKASNSSLKEEPIISELIPQETSSFKKNIEEIANPPIINSTAGASMDDPGDDVSRYYFEPVEEEDSSN